MKIYLNAKAFFFLVWYWNLTLIQTELFHSAAGNDVHQKKYEKLWESASEMRHHA